MVSLYQYVGLSIQKQSFTVQPNLLMYTLFKMFNSHLLLESWEYDDTVTKLQKLRVKLKPETPSEPLRYLGLWQVPVRAMMARLQEQSYLVSLPDIGCDRVLFWTITLGGMFPDGPSECDKSCFTPKNL